MIDTTLFDFYNLKPYDRALALRLDEVCKGRTVADEWLVRYVRNMPSGDKHILRQALNVHPRRNPAK